MLQALNCHVIGVSCVTMESVCAGFSSCQQLDLARSGLLHGVLAVVVLPWQKTVAKTVAGLCHCGDVAARVLVSPEQPFIRLCSSSRPGTSMSWMELHHTRDKQVYVLFQSFMAGDIRTCGEFRGLYTWRRQLQHRVCLYSLLPIGMSYKLQRCLTVYSKVDC
jgi:hypothetical protein